MTPLEPKHNVMLGYDRRMLSGSYVDKYWDEYRRNTFLLNPDIKWPLSVDHDVWPTIFEYHKWLEGSVSGEIIMLQNAATEWVDYSTDTWNDQKNMNSYASAINSELYLQSVQICICLAYDDVSFPDDCINPLIDRNTQVILSDRWKMLGYDVADIHYLSGLSNCSYDDSEIGSLRLEWTDKLNCYGLFTRYGYAKEYVNITNARVVEHAPFYTFAIYSDSDVLGM